MDNINISDLRANLLKYLKMAQRGESITVTSNGQVLATISPPIEQKDSARSKLKGLAETAVIGDVISPTDDNWDAL